MRGYTVAILSKHGFLKTKCVPTVIRDHKGAPFPLKSLKNTSTIAFRQFLKSVEINIDCFGILLKRKTQDLALKLACYSLSTF